MKAGATKPGPQTTYAFNFLGEWLTQEESNSSVNELGELVMALKELLDEHDKLLKYCRIVVRCHEKSNFEENVNAIRAYLVEELRIEP